MNRILKGLTMFNIGMVIIILITVVAMGCTKPTTETTETTDTEVEEPFDFSISKEWKNNIKTWEGFTSEPINDCGYWAVGYGHQVCPVTEPKPAPITREEAEALFETDIAHWEAVAIEWAAEHGFALTQGELNALVSFLYQFGFRSDYMEKVGYLGQDFILWKQGVISAEELMDEWQEYCHYKDADGVRHESAAIKARRLAEWREATK